MGGIFRFKQFQVDQQGCAMKINTDGVILGAICGFSADAVSYRALDIGTGTGVIAMMLAQRFDTALIDAVEIDESAAQTAGRNFSASPFAERLSVFNSDIAAFEISEAYDLIVSNPPYFVNDLKSFEKRKSIARHAEDSFFESLVVKSSEFLSDNGLLWLILPLKQADLVLSLAGRSGLHLKSVVNIQSDVSKPVIRKVICLSKHIEQVKEETFYIYESE
ncbi:MAG: methyltransferase domain-containing protein, partial [Pedobacter sp.]